jgi:uncharacterized 2Fe-2S/4Fe-4S cluster protein (DUF4445 family)
LAAPEAKIVFLPSGRRGVFPHGTALLDAARSLGVDVDSVCGGRGLCGRCRVICAVGDFSKHAIHSRAEHLSPAGEAENQFSERRRPLEENHRLSCQALIQGDLVIDVPAESQMHRQVVRKKAEYRDISLNTSVRLHVVELQPADLREATGDLQRLYDALNQEWQLAGLDCDPAVLPHLQRALREGGWQVTVAVHRFGEDLMSRVSYVLMHPEASDELTDVVRNGINELIADVSREADIEPVEILDVTVAGNPIMHHLFLGISPVELGGAPFALATDGALNLRARDLGLRINAGATVYVLPCIAGHVGADAAAMVLAEEPHLLEEISLVVDVGTNAEIVLGNRDRMFACSSPTGPAFEGAQISCGQRAAAGAIERVRVDRETLDVRFSVIGSDLWSDDPGFAEAVQAFGVTGICGSGIIEAVAEMYLAGVISEDGVIDGGLAERSPRIVPDDRTWTFVLYEGQQRIVVTQNDVRQIQLAKAALYAGVKLLLDRAGIEQVERIRLAGAFGSHIDPLYAMVLGLIPDCDLDAVESAGNAAGTGAAIALLDTSTRAEIEATVRDIEKIETAVEPKFQEYFVDAMAIPNKNDTFPKLFSVVTRPQSDTSPVRSNTGRPRRRRRQRTR